MEAIADLQKAMDRWEEACLLREVHKQAQMSLLPLTSERLRMLARMVRARFHPGFQQDQGLPRGTREN